MPFLVPQLGSGRWGIKPPPPHTGSLSDDQNSWRVLGGVAGQSSARFIFNLISAGLPNHISSPNVIPPPQPSPGLAVLMISEPRDPPCAPCPPLPASPRHTPARTFLGWPDWLTHLRQPECAPLTFPVLFVHPANRDPSLTNQQLRRICGNQLESALSCGKIDPMERVHKLCWVGTTQRGGGEPSR